jgi:short-subunit dehydrogenase
MFKNRVAVITGAGSGIGRGLALALARREVKLCLVGRDRDKLKETAFLAQAFSPHIGIYQIDLTKDEDIAKLALRVKEDVGDVDFLIHSAGVIYFGDLQTTAVAELDRQYRTNVRAPYLLTQTLLSSLLLRQGQIVFLNSSAVFSVKAGLGQYAASKHALKAMADSLRAEVHPLGVRVISIYPGRTASPMQALICELEGKVYEPASCLQPADVALAVTRALGLPRMVALTDIDLRSFQPD